MPSLADILDSGPVNRLKQSRRIATRYEKTARAYLSMLCIAAPRLWIKTVNTA
jgi:transposase